MTTRIDTPRPASTQPPSDRSAGGMDGWRIEVRPEAHGERQLVVDRPGDMKFAMQLASFVVTPTVVRAGEDPRVWACFDPLFETIYVSREVTDEEAETLRRLLHEEEQRRLREAQAATVWLAVRTVCEAIEAQPNIPPEARQVLTEVRERMGESRGVFFTALDGMREWSCPRCNALICDRLVGSLRFQHKCGFDSHPPATEAKPIESEPKPWQRRVPQVGDLIEALDLELHRWWLVRVIERGILDGKGCFRAQSATGAFVFTSGDTEGNWHWPEDAQR